MDIDQYSTEVLQYRNPSVIDDDVITNAALGLVGESAELQKEVTKAMQQWLKLFEGSLNLTDASSNVSEMIKKIKFQDQNIPLEKIIRELGDVAYYFVDCCVAIGVRPSDVLSVNLCKLENRYPNGKFEAKASQNRCEVRE